MFGLNFSADPADAIDLLTSDHDEVDQLFEEYEQAKDQRGAAKSRIALRICRALTVHAAVEEEIFYPAVRRAREDVAELIDEAAVEHQSLKDIIGRLEAAPASDPLYDAGIKVLQEYVKHHVKEEESELFPKVRKLDLDLATLGERMKARKAELQDAQAPGPRRRAGRRAVRSPAAA